MIWILSLLEFEWLNGAVGNDYYDDDIELVSNFDILFLHRDVVQSKLENLGQVILLVCVCVHVDLCLYFSRELWVCFYIKI